MLKVKKLVKKYDKFIAVNDISFEINKGEILGFLGPNGAGKSTTMNIISGYIKATSGEVLIGDYNVEKNPIDAKKLIGYLPENPPLYIDMKVSEYIKFVVELKNVNKEDRKDEIDRVISLTGLDEVKGRLIRNLSKGYKQRVGIAQAIVGNPDLVILDEPTVGLDPNQIIEIRNLIKSLKNEHTVIISTHILSEVDMLCDKVIIINKGEIKANDKLEVLTKDKSLEEVFVELTNQEVIVDEEEKLEEESLDENKDIEIEDADEKEEE